MTVRTIGACAVLALSAACRPEAVPTPVPGGRPTVADACLLTAIGETPQAVTVALGDSVDPAHAPRPTNAAERVLFRQLYETLVRADCTGRLLPALAETWRTDDDGRTWTFTLREEARFWDGVPVTAREVRAAWARTGARVAVSVTGARTMSVTLASPVSEPLLFADPALAVARPLAESPWPLGTGAYWVGAGVVDTPATITARPVAVGRGAPARELAFQIAAGADGRDLLDGGQVDVLLTADRSVLDYAGRLEPFSVTSLSWDRVYVLLAPSRVTARAPAAISPRFGERLARDAVRADARGAEPPFWWRGQEACGLAPRAERPGPAPLPAERARVAFPRGDDIAWDLAARLVALAGSDASAEGVTMAGLVPALGTAGGVAALGLPPDEFAAALASRTDAAYVVALPRRPFGACHELRRLLERAPWLAGADLRRAIVPLIDVRTSLVARQGAGAGTLDLDGALHFER